MLLAEKLLPRNVFIHFSHSLIWCLCIFMFIFVFNPLFYIQSWVFLFLRVDAVNYRQLRMWMRIAMRRRVTPIPITLIFWLSRHTERSPQPTTTIIIIIIITCHLVLFYRCLGLDLLTRYDSELILQLCESFRHWQVFLLGRYAHRRPLSIQDSTRQYRETRP
jgi:hypothetical protein